MISLNNQKKIKMLVVLPAAISTIIFFTGYMLVLIQGLVILPFNDQLFANLVTALERKDLLVLILKIMLLAGVIMFVVGCLALIDEKSPQTARFISKLLLIVFVVFSLFFIVDGMTNGWRHGSANVNLKNKFYVM
jgi:hypothetical protein